MYFFSILNDIGGFIIELFSKKRKADYVSYDTLQILIGLAVVFLVFIFVYIINFYGK